METYWSRFARDLDHREAYVAGSDLIGLVTTKLNGLHRLGRVLELGCGTGAFTGSIAAAADELVATDYSSQMIDAARALFAHIGNVRVEKADAVNTGYPDGSFDTVFSANLIHVIPHPRRMLYEVRRVLRPGGLLILTCFTTDTMTIVDKLTLLYRYLRTFGPFPKGGTPFTLRSLSVLITAEGFTVEEAVLLGTATKSIFLLARKKAGAS